ncbi:paraslipin [Leptospira levettii]|uniref:SPFH domain-containing protein n=1 Tax=Leptospira levettii TaxID=2023178 RepID=UPI000C29CE7B|nr:stomatin-like protein [Leptospira levettii]MCW7498219.1 paraslipin [Leptospira levettii]PKA26996.1 paraslipin [Leptospira sp. mixed culture ATI2-C-A1]TGM33588.1 paraslipin [Leptospira levettii]TGM93764.1 paraslipin [Leptospira levettii]
MGATVIVVFLVIVYIIKKTIIIVPEQSVFIKERLGVLNGVLKSGFYFMIPFVDQIRYRQNLKEQTIDIDPQVCITKDNVSVEVDGVLYLKVIDGEKASYGIDNFMLATTQLAQTTLRSEIGKLIFDNLLSERDEINGRVVSNIDRATDPWGIKVTRYEIRNITPPKQILIEMENQMKSERERRAEITISQGEKESRVNHSVGERQESINISEGEKIRLVNEADGRAQEITLISNATAKGLQLISEAISKKGGKEAVSLQITQEYLDALGHILKTSKTTVVPETLANIGGVFEGLSKITTKIPQVGE